MARRNVPVVDLHELFKRICFNILIGNDDDHPKNVAVIYQKSECACLPCMTCCQPPNDRHLPGLQ